MVDFVQDPAFQMPPSDWMDSDAEEGQYGNVDNQIGILDRLIPALKEGSYMLPGTGDVMSAMDSVEAAKAAMEAERLRDKLKLWALSGVAAAGAVPGVSALWDASGPAVKKMINKAIAESQKFGPQLVTPGGGTVDTSILQMGKVEMPGSGKGRPGIGTGKGPSPREIVVKNQRDYISKYLEDIYNNAPKVGKKADLPTNWYRGSIKDDIVASNPKLFPDGLNTEQYGFLLAGKVKNVRGKKVVTGDKVNIVNSPVTGKLETAENAFKKAYAKDYKNILKKEGLDINKSVLGLMSANSPSFRYLNFIRRTAPENLRNNPKAFLNKYNPNDLKNSGDFKRFQLLDQARIDVNKIIKPILLKLFPKEKTVSMQIAHMFESGGIQKGFVSPDKILKGGSPKHMYMDISTINIMQQQKKWEPAARTAIKNFRETKDMKYYDELLDIHEKMKSAGVQGEAFGFQLGEVQPFMTRFPNLIKNAYKSGRLHPDDLVIHPVTKKKVTIDSLANEVYTSMEKATEVTKKQRRSYGVTTTGSLGERIPLMKDGGEVQKFAAGGPNFVADPAFDMPNEKFEMSDLTQFVPPHWRQAGQDIKQGLGYLKEKFVDRPMELDYAQKETKTETLLNTIEQMGYDISPFYGVLRAGKMFNEDTARALEEYMTGEYGEMGKSVLMAAMATLGMIPVVGTEARVVRGAIGQTKKAIRPKVGGTVKITSKEDVTPGVTGEPGSVVMSRDGKPLVVAADGTYHPMPVFESKLEKSLNLTDAPQSATTEQWLEYFRKNGVNERELAEAGILDELNRAKTFERSTPNEQLKTMYEESSARNLNIIEKTEGGRGDNKARHKHAGSDETGFDQAGENYHEVVFQSGTVKGDPDAFVQGSHYKEPNVLAFTRNKNYTTTDNINVTAIQEWQTDLGAQAFDQQKKLKEILEGLRGQELVDAPKTVYRPFPVPEAGLKILIDEINAIDGELAALMPQKVAPAVDVAPGAVISKMYGTETRGVPPIFKMEPENTPKMLDLMKRQQNVIDEMMKMDTVQNYLKQMEGMGVDKTFPNVPFKNELDLMRLTIKANARMAAENGQQGLVIANSDIVNGRWNKKLVKRQYDVEGQLFDTKEEAIAWKDANNPQAKVKTVIDEKSSGYKFFQIYDQKLPQVMNEIAKEMGSNVVMKEIAVGVNNKPFVIKNKQGDVVDSFRTMEEAKQAYPQAKSQPEIWAAEEFAGTPPAAGHERLPAEITNFFIDVERMKTQQVFMLELNDNFLYPQAIYKRHGGLVESSLKSINDIMRPL